MDDESILDPDNERFTSLSSVGPASGIRGRMPILTYRASRPQVAVSPRVQDPIIPVPAGGSTARWNAPTYVLAPIDRAFIGEPQTDLDCSEVSNVFQTIGFENGDVFTSLQQILKRNPNELLEMGRKMTLRNKEDVVNPLMHHLKTHGKDTVLVSMARISGGIQFKVENGRPDEMEQAYNTITRACSSDAFVEKCPWPANLFFVIQLVYALYTRCYYNAKNCQAMAESFKKVQSVYFNRLQIAMRLMGQPISAEFVCSEITVQLKRTIASTVADMNRINDAVERMDRITTSLVSGIFFPSVVRIHQTQKILEARELAAAMTRAKRIMDETLEEDLAHNMEILENIGGAEEP